MSSLISSGNCTTLNAGSLQVLRKCALLIDPDTARGGVKVELSRPLDWREFLPIKCPSPEHR